MNLRTLYVGGNELTNIEVVKNMPSLACLGLSGNTISDFSPLQGLSNLMNLSVSNTGLTQLDTFVSYIEGLKMLTNLDLGDDQLVSIKPLEKLTSLKYLWINNAGLTDISGLEGLKSLSELGLGSNQITDITVLSKLPRLEYVYLWDNQITDLASLLSLDYLRYVELSGNTLNATMRSQIDQLLAKNVRVYHEDITTPDPDPDPTPTPTPDPTPTPNPGTSDNTDTSSGGGGGSDTTTTVVETAEEVITHLEDTVKEEIVAKFQEEVPYTSLTPTLTIEQLNDLTGGHFTEEQLEEMLENPELLEALGIDLSVLDNQVFLTPIEDATFSDVSESHWANDVIKQAAALGLVAGMPDGSFDPDAPLQMSDTFTFLDRILLLNGIEAMKLPRSTVEQYITDTDHWAFAHMGSIASKLTEDTLIQVVALGDEPMNRGLLAQIIFELVGDVLPEVREGMRFSDVEDSPYAAAIDFCVKAGLLSGMGDGTMGVDAPITRAQLMSVLIRMNDCLESALAVEEEAEEEAEADGEVEVDSATEEAEVTATP